MRDEGCGKVLNGREKNVGGWRDRASKRRVLAVRNIGQVHSAFAPRHDSIPRKQAKNL